MLHKSDSADLNFAILKYDYWEHTTKHTFSKYIHKSISKDILY